MRQRIGTIIAGLLLLIVAAPAFSQNARVMSVNVPFAFSVGQRQLPAGQYEVLSNSQGNFILWGKQHTIALTDDVDSKAVEHSASLVFLRSGEQYSLFQIWTSNAHVGHELVAPAFNSKNTLAKAQSVEVLALGQ